MSKKLVLFGDSLFGQVGKYRIVLLEDKLNGQYDVYNCAVGGWDSTDLVKKADYIAGLQPDVLVLSVGTNDASPWKRVELSEYEKCVRQVLNTFAASRIIFFLPPAVNEASMPPGSEKRILNQEISQYYETAKNICDEMKIEYIESHKLFELSTDVPDNYHVADGVHLTEDAYTVLLDDIARILQP